MLSSPSGEDCTLSHSVTAATQNTDAACSSIWDGCSNPAICTAECNNACRTGQAEANGVPKTPGAKPSGFKQPRPPPTELELPVLASNGDTKFLRFSQLFAESAPPQELHSRVLTRRPQQGLWTTLILVNLTPVMHCIGSLHDGAARHRELSLWNSACQSLLLVVSQMC